MVNRIFLERSFGAKNESREGIITKATFTEKNPKFPNVYEKVKLNHVYVYG
jgi:hypothetical protein